MNEMFGRAIDDINDTIFKAAGGKGVENMQDPDRARHCSRSVLKFVEPEAKHQDIP
jgi:hypothetical protein